MPGFLEELAHVDDKQEAIGHLKEPEVHIYANLHSFALQGKQMVRFQHKSGREKGLHLSNQKISLGNAGK